MKEVPHSERQTGIHASLTLSLKTMQGAFIMVGVYIRINKVVSCAYFQL